MLYAGVVAFDYLLHMHFNVNYFNDTAGFWSGQCKGRFILCGCLHTNSILTLFPK